MPSIQEKPIRFDDNKGVASANETFRVAFPVPVGGSDTNQGVAKYDKPAGNTSMANDQFMGLDDSMVSLTDDGYAATRDLNLITRSTATSEVNKALGLSVVVDEAYAKSPDGTPINVSAMALGTQVTASVSSPDGRVVQTSAAFDFSRPEIQKGLYDLEAIDYLTGQIDRHGGNFFINNDTGEVKGIDNDLCFGSKPLSEAVKDQAIGAKAVGKPPYFYHEDTARRLEEMTPERLRSILRDVSSPDGGNRLSEQEIEAAVQRLEEMKADIKIARAEGRVVAKFGPDTYQQSIEHNQKVAGAPGSDGKFGATGNYVGRCAAELAVAQARAQQNVEGFAVQTPQTPPSDDFRRSTQAAKAEVSQARQEALDQPTEQTNAAKQKVGQLEQQAEALRQEIQQKLAPKLDQRNKSIAMQEQSAKRKISDAAILGNLRMESNPLTADQAKLVKVTTGIDVKEGDRLTPEQKQKLPAAIRNLKEGAEKSLNSINQINESFLKEASSEIQALNEISAELDAARNELEAAIQADPRVVSAQQKMDAHQNRQKEHLIMESDAQLRAKNNPWQQRGVSEEQKKPSVRDALIGESRKKKELQPQAEQVEMKEEAKIDPSLPKKDNTKKMREIFERQGTDASVKQGVIR